MVKYMDNEVPQPVTSEARRGIPAEIPPFTYPEELEVTLTGNWSPKYDILLTSGYVQANGPGTGLAGFAICRKQHFEPEPFVLATAFLQANSYKAVFTFDNSVIPKMVSPFDSVFIASFAESGHMNVVIQLIGEKLL